MVYGGVLAVLLCNMHKGLVGVQMVLRLLNADFCVFFAIFCYFGLIFAIFGAVLWWLFVHVAQSNKCFVQIAQILG